VALALYRGMHRGAAEPVTWRVTNRAWLTWQDLSRHMPGRGTAVPRSMARAAVRE